MYLYQLEFSFNNEKVRKPIFLKFRHSLLEQVNVFTVHPTHDSLIPHWFKEALS